MTILLQKRLAVWMGASLLGGATFGVQNPVQAWPKGVPYPNPKKVSVKIALPTPRQRYQGYDRQVIITAKSEGVGVANAKLHFVRNGKNGVIPLTLSRDFFDTVNRNQTVFPIKLASVPAQLGALTLTADVFLADYSYIPRRGGRYITSSTGERIPVPIPADRIKITVRRAGQKITPVNVNTSRSFRVGEAKVLGPSLFASPDRLDLSRKPGNPSSLRNGASVLITLLNVKGEKRQPQGNVTFDNVRLVTAKGGVHPLMDGKAGQIITQLTNDVDTKTDEPIRYLFGCNFKHIPSSKGALHFKTEVSINNCWPRSVSIRVR